jgi:hypothetical protein
MLWEIRFRPILSQHFTQPMKDCIIINMWTSFEVGLRFSWPTSRSHFFPPLARVFYYRYESLIPSASWFCTKGSTHLSMLPPLEVLSTRIAVIQLTTRYLTSNLEKHGLSMIPWSYPKYIQFCKYLEADLYAQSVWRHLTQIIGPEFYMTSSKSCACRSPIWSCIYSYIAEEVFFL